MTAYDLLESLRSRDAWLEVLPTGGLAVEVQGDHELDDADVEAIRQHKTMLVRWALAAIVGKQVGLEVEIAEWTGRVLPEPDWPGLRPRDAYQVVPSDLMPADPALEGFWTLVYVTPRLYRTPLRATKGFIRAWNRHLERLRRRSEVPSHPEAPAQPPWPPRPPELSEWPAEWRRRWGCRANALWDQGVPWPQHEIQAFGEVKAEVGRMGVPPCDPEPGVSHASIEVQGSLL
jgi:hypothetical protein